MVPLLDTLELTWHQSSDNTGNQCIEKSQLSSVLDHPRTKHKLSKNSTILRRKAYAKYKTVESVLDLIDLHSEFESRYWDTFHCCETIEVQGQYITGHYCGNRWCRVCGRILTAKLIQAYKPALSNFQNPWFVTLTIVNVTESELAPAIKKMVQTFNKINHNFRHRRPYRIFGIRKIEVEPSEHKGEYHPHFHVILESECVAQALIQEWLLSYPTADIRGQDATKCDPGSLAEFFKYTTKPVVKTKSGDPEKKNHTAYQLDVIYRSLDKKRIFQPIGIKKAPPGTEEIEGIRAQRIPDLKFLQLKECEIWTWKQEYKDWISLFGDRLSHYKMNKELPGYISTPGYCRRN